MEFPTFAKNFFKIVKDIYEPLALTALRFHEEGEPEPDVLDSLFLSFWLIGHAMCGSDGTIHGKEAIILSQLESLFPGRAEVPPESIYDFLGERTGEDWDKIYNLAREKPFPLSLLEIYDDYHGTSKSDSLRHLYLSFAVVMANADGLEKDGESAYLADLHDILYEKQKSNLNNDRIINNAFIEKKSNQKSEISEEKIIYSQDRSIDDSMAELYNLIGLSPVKEEINNLVNIIKVNNMRKEKGLQTIQMSNHLIFYGNPGTGKTTIARLVAEIYKGLGVLSSGHLVETDRSGLVAGYVGQTAIKVKEVVESAKGGILFIDEAYTLNTERDDYGKEAIATLLKLMEDHRNDLVVIAAGYPDKMRFFLESNPGLKSRFNKFLDFPDYSPEELQLIFKKMIKDAGLILTNSALSKVSEIFSTVWSSKDEYFGNGRFVRNFFNDCVSRQANRLVSLPSNNVNESTLNTIDIDDIVVLNNHTKCSK